MWGGGRPPSPYGLSANALNIKIRSSTLMSNPVKNSGWVLSLSPKHFHFLVTDYNPAQLSSSLVVSKNICLSPASDQA